MYCRGHHDAMAQWQRVGFQIPRLGVRIPLASDKIFFENKTFFIRAKTEKPNCDPALPGRALDAMAQWQRVGFQILRLGVRVPLASFNQKL